jgi:hypothetical protein
MAPRSSVPFHSARDRQARYAAEVTLAIKEQRRDATSEAAANGRIVLPQMPEIWGSTDHGLPGPAPAAGPLGWLDPPAPEPPLPRRCVAVPPACEGPLPVAGLAPVLLSEAAIAPAAAPRAPEPDYDVPLYRFQLHFGRDSSVLDAAAQRVLATAVGSARMIRPIRIVVAGHAGAGSDACQERLAQRRAAAVAGALLRAGVPADLIETTAGGEPALRSGDDGAPHPNRRVEIVLA